MEYSVSKYGKEWAVFSATTKTYVLFGNKHEMKKRCAELNRENKPTKTTIIDAFNAYFDSKAGQ